MKQLEYLSAAEIGREVNAGHISPTEVVRYFEQRIADGNGDLNAFVYTKFEEAEAAARQLEERLARGEDVGPFAGVPFALKDFLPSKKGWTHSHGGVKALIREDPVDSEFTKAMEAAGGIAIGKTNAPAFGFRGTTDNHLYGPTCNPFDHRYNAGGSSGGSAAAVARVQSLRRDRPERHSPGCLVGDPPVLLQRRSDENRGRQRHPHELHGAL